MNKACQVMSISKSSHYYKPKKQDEDMEIKRYLLDLASKHRRWGFDKMMQKSRLDGKGWNHKRVRRIYCELALNSRIKPRKRLPKGEAKVLEQPIESNICWSIDFMSDALMTGRRFRKLNVMDDYNREALMITPSYNLPAERVTNLLDQVIADRGKPEFIKIHNGSEFTANFFRSWAATRGITLNYIQPGKPAQNGFIERFNRTYREDVLDMNLFTSLEEVCEITKDWIESYNILRPHESLDGLTPVIYTNTRQYRQRHLSS